MSVGEGRVPRVVRVAATTAVEVGWLAAHVATYPLGLLSDRGHDLPDDRYGTRGLGPAQRGLIHTAVESATTPIVLVHGLVDNRTVFTFLRKTLVRRGFTTLRTFSYGPATRDVRETAARFGEFVEEVCTDLDVDRVRVVGHSLGGLIARYYVQRLGGDVRVDLLITLGSPHEGTRTAHLLPMPLVRQLRPDSPVIRELAEPAPDCQTRFMAVHSNADELMVPTESARLAHADLDVRNVLVQGVGHVSLPVHPGVVHRIASALAGPEAPVTRVTGGTSRGPERVL